jgi:Tfp pilus assembly protein PilP
MRLTIAILSMSLAGSAWAQNPDVIQDTRSTMKALQFKQQVESDRALGLNQPAVKTNTTAQAPGKVVVRRDPLKPAKAAKHKEMVAVERSASAKPATTEAPKTVRLSGRRDPFVSPVVSQAMVASGCSVGKRCLAVDQIALKGVVKSDSGMIAVVVNAVEKAYFLRENDPVFNGYVVKITGDSIIFKETVRDRLGKAFEREVTKKITTPAV